MRIFLSCLQSLKKHPVTSYGHWRDYFLNGCQEAGIECVEVPAIDWVEGAVLPPGDEQRAWSLRTWESVIEFVRREHARKPLDFFLGYLYPQQVNVEAIQQLQSMGIPCVNFFCDNVRQFQTLPHEYRVFDLHWVPEYQALGLYRKAGLSYIHAAMPCWVPPNQRTSEHPETFGVTFVGSPDELRRQLMGEAIHAGAAIDIYGMGWKGEFAPSQVLKKTAGQLIANQWRDIRQFGIRSWLLKFERQFWPLPDPPVIPPDRLLGKLSAEDLVRVMQQSSITLGINRVATHYRSQRNFITYSRLRDIEAPMMGACYLTEWSEDLEHLYDIGSEIETYRTVDELNEKVKSLLGDKNKRQNMRRLAQTRALTDHTVGKSLNLIKLRF